MIRNETMRQSVCHAGRVLGDKSCLRRFTDQEGDGILEACGVVTRAQQKDSLSLRIIPNSSASCNLVAAMTIDLQNGK